MKTYSTSLVISENTRFHCTPTKMPSVECLMSNIQHSVEHLTLLELRSKCSRPKEALKEEMVMKWGWEKEPQKETEKQSEVGGEQNKAEPLSRTPGAKSQSTSI